MGTYRFNLPDIGEGIAEAEIVAWHVAVGDVVEEDGPLADLMTDKATVAIESPVAGRVVSLGGEEGDLLAIGAPLVVLEIEGEGTGEDSPGPEVAISDPAPHPAEPEPVPFVSSEVETSGETPEIGVSTGSKRTDGADRGRKVLASAAVRARAKDLGIGLADIRPASPDRRIRHADLDALLAYGGAKGYAPAGRARPDEQVRVIGLRRRIAENMAAAKRAIPHFTYVEECDVTALEALRADLNAHRGERPRLTMLPLLIAALCRALPDFPMLNARYDDEAGIVTRHGAVHIGIATQTDAGLMVPVIRDAQAKNLWQLAAEIARLADAARSGSALSEELSGSTFTLSSLGPLGGIASTPVINRPEVAILAPNRIVERPMFAPDGIGGERVEKRKLMNLSLSCDHRVVDGHDAASFVHAVKRLIEAPALLLVAE